MRAIRWLAPLVAALVPAAVLAAGIEGIDVLSNRADLISGGDALVAARLAPGTDAAAVRVTLNGSDITSRFAVRENGQYAGLVTGLVAAENLLRARLPDGSGHEITIRNHPIGGPVFSGEQIQPWLCRTQLNRHHPVARRGGRREVQRRRAGSRAVLPQHRQTSGWSTTRRARRRRS